MASNPIQKKVRNAGLIGAAITLLIMGVVVAFLLMELNRVEKEKQEIETSFASVYTINRNVKSGQVITRDMLTATDVPIQNVPNNAITDANTINNYFLSDSEGHEVYSDEIGMYIKKDCEYMEVYKENNKYYTYTENGEKIEATGVNDSQLYTDDFHEGQYYLVRNTPNKTRIYKETQTDEFYVLRIKYDRTNQGTVVREKEYIKILETPLVAKINIEQKTALTLEMLSTGSLLTDDVRKQEYNAIVLPVDLTTGDYVDIRVQLPNGQDYIVISKKMVELPFINGMESENTVWLNLSEDEILSMSCAIVEAYRINGAKLYATKYTDPGIQDAAEKTYPISRELMELVLNDPNVTDTAEEELLNRYKEFSTIRDNYLNSELAKPENSSSNVPGKINESIVKTQEERKDYLQSLANGY